MSRPRLISPIDHVDEAALLVQAGADELYGGVVPQSWLERYGLLGSLNQRTFAQAQLKSFDELQAVVELAGEHGKPFSLTLNAPFYTAEQLPLIEELVGHAVDIGVAGVILADPGLLVHLYRLYPRLELHVSTLAHAGNVASLRYYQKLGASRAVIPRHHSTGEIGEMVSALPQMRLDAFVLVGKCPNTEGLCTFHHSREDRVWPCEIPYEITPLEESPSLRLENARKKQLSWSQSNRRHGCALCALPALVEAGVYGLKLVGRGAPPAMKKANILLVKRFLELSTKLGNSSDYRRQARQAHAQRFGSPCCANVCYYPEFFQGE